VRKPAPIYVRNSAPKPAPTSASETTPAVPAEAASTCRQAVAVGECPHCHSIVAQHTISVASDVICSSCAARLEAKQLLIAVDPPKGEDCGTPPLCLTDLQRLSGRSFEQLLGILFKRMGLKTLVTQETRDQGADLVLTGSGECVAVQAKRQLQDVGNGAVQALLGGMLYYDCSRGIVVTTAGFTVSARQLAGRHSGILLWGGALVEKLSCLYLAGSIVLLLEADRALEARE
jgi:hypothetical protein